MTRAISIALLAIIVANGDALAENPPALPRANHPMWFGYYYEDAARYGDFQAEVADYTNLYYALARGGYEDDSSATNEECSANLRRALKRVVESGTRKILLNLNRRDSEARIPPIDSVLSDAAPFWERVELIELADEPRWDKLQTEAQIRAVRQSMRERGLSDRPIGLVLEQRFSLKTDAINADGLDFVSLEAYVNPPGHNDPKTNAEELRSYIDTMKARIPAGKKLLLVMMAYDRNGQWTNVRTLVDLQYQAYLLACNDPRIIGITMFSYGRPGGTRDHAELRMAHQRIAKSMGIPHPTTAATEN